MFYLCPRNKIYRDTYHPYNSHGPIIILQHNWQKYHPGNYTKRQKSVMKTLHGAFALTKPISQIKNNRQFRKLGRLKRSIENHKPISGDRSKIFPKNHYGNQHQNHHSKEKRRNFFPKFYWQFPGYQKSNQTEPKPE